MSARSVRRLSMCILFFGLCCQMEHIFKTYTMFFNFQNSVLEMLVHVNPFFEISTLNGIFQQIFKIENCKLAHFVNSFIKYVYASAFQFKWTVI